MGFAISMIFAKVAVVSPSVSVLLPFLFAVIFSSVSHFSMLSMMAVLIMAMRVQKRRMLLHRPLAPETRSWSRPFSDVFIRDTDSGSC